MWEVSFQVKRKPWLNNPEMRWNEGLRRAGLNFRQGLQRSHYPPIPPTDDVRTYATADKADFNITDFGREMEFGSTFYLGFILGGTYKWQGWPGKKDELMDLMRMGFISGIKEYE